MVSAQIFFRIVRQEFLDYPDKPLRCSAVGGVLDPRYGGVCEIDNFGDARETTGSFLGLTPCRYALLQQLGLYLRDALDVVQALGDIVRGEERVWWRLRACHASDGSASE
jgi:hypothetical protein